MWNLWRNERVKIYKRTTVWVLWAVVILMVFGQIGLTEYIRRIDQQAAPSASWESAYNDCIHTLKIALDTTLAEQKGQLQEQIDFYTFALTLKIAPTDWRSESLARYISFKNQIRLLSADLQKAGIPVADSKEYTQLEEAETTEWNLLQQKDWRSYTKGKIDRFSRDDSLSEDEKTVYREMYSWYLSYAVEPFPDASSIQREISVSLASFLDEATEEDYPNLWRVRQIESAKQNKLALLQGETQDAEGQVILMTPQQRGKIEQQIRLSSKRLETNQKPISEDATPWKMETFASTMMHAALLVIVLGGGILAEEYNAGTIKLLLIAPHRRQKIYWAKAAVLLEVLLWTFLLVLLAAFVACGSFFGFHDCGAGDVVSLFGNVVCLPYWLHVLGAYALGLIPALTYGAMALMLSAVLRHSTVAIAIPLLMVYVAQNVTAQIVGGSQTRIPGQIFILSVNTQLTSYLSSAAAARNLLPTIGANEGVSLSFSIGVLLVYTVCFLWIGRDSFCHRDI